MAETIILADQVIDGVSPEPMPDGAVVVRDDRIVEVLPRDRLASTRLREAQVVEGAGQTVMPGLIDCHVHLVFHQMPTMVRIDAMSVESATLRAADNARILVENGYTTVRDVGSRGAASISVGRAIREGRLRGPRVFACGPLITTTAGTADSYPTWITNSAGIGKVCDGPTEIQAEVRRQSKMGASHIKLGLSGSEPSVYAFTWMTTMSQEEVSMAVAEAHRLRLRVACHSEAEDSSLYAARAGCDTIEHGTRLNEETVDMMVTKGIFLVPTLCTLHSVLELGEALGLGQKQRDEMEVNKGPWLDSLRMAREMGTRVAAGGDVGNRYPHGENAREIIFLAEQGFSPMEALQSATSVAAGALGLGNQLGQLAPGYAADLILLQGDPLQNLNLLLNRERITQVMIGGRWIKDSPVPRMAMKPIPAI